jgi:hypothetical protein
MLKLEARGADASPVGIAAVHTDENALTPRSHNGATGRGGGIAAYVDGSPSKGRVRKALRAEASATPMASNPLYTRPRDDVYETVVDKASKLFAVIRQTVVCELAPSALKSTFLDPLHSSLFNEVRAVPRHGVGPSTASC